jgi:hypothetical protein
MMGMELVLETSVIINQLTRLITQEDVINVSRRESFRSHIFSFLYDSGNLRIKLNAGGITDSKEWKKNLA